MKREILSAGIDIGTSTTCLVFSKLVVENVANSFQIPDARFSEKNVFYRSPIYFTPLISDTELDVEKIVQIIQQEYKKAGVLPKDVETGAVIITGDTARKSNARKVVEAISDFAGDFVVATVGPELESILAGKGSGAAQYSVSHTVLVSNCDIGGGTSNLASFYNGKVMNAACLNIGGRLIRFVPGSMKVEYIYPEIRQLAEKEGISVQKGDILSREAVMRITDRMAENLLREMRMDSSEQVYSFSGGVGELIYAKQLPYELEYSDIGVFLADSIRKQLAKESTSLIQPAETIGATVIGTSNYSMDISGSTVTVSASDLLPLQNIPIVKVENAIHLTETEFVEFVNKNLNWIRGNEDYENIALAVSFQERISFTKVQELSGFIVKAMQPVFSQSKAPLIVVLESDYGKVMGQTLRRLVGREREVFCIDNIDIGNGDYLDIGKPLGLGDAVPVVIKTLAFSY